MMARMNHGAAFADVALGLASGIVRRRSKVIEYDGGPRARRI